MASSSSSPFNPSSPFNLPSPNQRRLNNRYCWISPQNNNNTLLCNPFALACKASSPNVAQTKLVLNNMQLFAFSGNHHGLEQHHVCRNKGLGLAQTRVSKIGFSASASKTKVVFNNMQLFAFSGNHHGLEQHHVCRNKGLGLGLGLAQTRVSAVSAPTSSDCEEAGNCKDSYNLKGWTPPRHVWRALAAWVIAGQVISRVVRGRIHLKNSLQQLRVVGPGSIGVCLLTSAFVGMAFTIQFVREFTRLGLTRSVGGVLALAFSRELSPVVTAIVIAGRVGSAFAAELGTMQVSEQTDTLRVLGTDPIDYLVIPRVFACCVALPILTLICFTVAMAASVLLADGVYSVSANIILDSARRALNPWDIVSAMIKSTVFGGLISVVSCAWGVTTLGGAKGVGESTTSAVVISLVCIFIADFVLSWCFFQGAGDALKAAMG